MSVVAYIYISYNPPSLPAPDCSVFRIPKSIKKHAQTHTLKIYGFKKSRVFVSACIMSLLAHIAPGFIPVQPTSELQKPCPDIGSEASKEAGLGSVFTVESGSGKSIPDAVD